MTDNQITEIKSEMIVDECYWSPYTGWRLRFGRRELWEIKEGYKVADFYPGTGYLMNKKFTDFKKAMAYLIKDKKVKNKNWGDFEELMRGPNKE